MCGLNYYTQSKCEIRFISDAHKVASIMKEFTSNYLFIYHLFLVFIFAAPSHDCFVTQNEIDGNRNFSRNDDKIYEKATPIYDYSTLFPTITSEVSNLKKKNGKNELS